MAKGDKADVSEGGLWGNEFLEGHIGMTEETCGGGGLAFVDDAGEV